MKTLDGIVVSDKMQKTVVVEVSRRVAHPLYKKLLKKSKKFKADSKEVTAKVGDTVRIAEVTPISKDKHFKVIKVLEERKK